MSRTADHSARPGELNGLVGVLGGRAERDALAARHQTLAPEIAANLRARSPDPVGTDAVAAAVVEVWWLKRFYAAPDTDGPTWTAAIAGRRASERPRADDGPATGSRARPVPPRRARQVPHRQSHEDLAALLDQYLPADPPAQHQTGRTGEASPT